MRCWWLKCHQMFATFQKIILVELCRYGNGSATRSWSVSGGAHLSMNQDDPGTAGLLSRQSEQTARCWCGTASIQVLVFKRNWGTKVFPSSLQFEWHWVQHGLTCDRTDRSMRPLLCSSAEHLLQRVPVFIHSSLHIQKKIRSADDEPVQQLA